MSQTALHPNAARRFQTQYEKVAGQVHRVPSSRGAGNAIKTILQKENTTSAVFTNDVNLFFEPSNDLVATLGAIPMQLRPADHLTALEISESDVGISTVSFAIAAVGAIVEVTLQDAERLVSTLPQTHIAMLRTSEVVETLEDAATRLRDYYEKHPMNCNITFISGPSRTADIEMQLFLGVHGPQQSHVILCDY